MNRETVFRPFGVEVLLFLVGITSMAKSLLDGFLSRLSSEDIFVAYSLNGLAVKMECSFCLLLQFAFRDPSAILKEVFLRSSEALIPNKSRLTIAGIEPLEIRFRCTKGHFLPTEHRGSSFHRIGDKTIIAHTFGSGKKKLPIHLPPTLCLEGGDFSVNMLKMPMQEYH
jgi:hypothetical protein